jgi:hypothetical protein
VDSVIAIRMSLSEMILAVPETRNYEAVLNHVHQLMLVCASTTQYTLKLGSDAARPLDKRKDDDWWDERAPVGVNGLELIRAHQMC